MKTIFFSIIHMSVFVQFITNPGYIFFTEASVKIYRPKEDEHLDSIMYSPTIFDENPDFVDMLKHPCRRPCEDNSTGPMECYYSFKLESYRTMSKACYNCPLNITDCFRQHCVPADGLKRSIQVVNRQIPGPIIEICQGDRLIVDVTNLMLTESTTMHWHGQHHRTSPYMDGVPYVTQCPIPPGSTFRYYYSAATAGTHFWHSHSGFQRGDGVFGPLIVRPPVSQDHHRDLYDVDEHVIVILDWDHETGSEKFLAHHHSDGNNKPPNILINGLGRYKSNRNDAENRKNMPLATFTVNKNLRYRFRLINAEFLNCPIEMSIDNHTMYIVSTDGNDIEPLKASSLVSYAGERFDIIVEMNQKINNYWMRFRGLMDCDERFLNATQNAILRYSGAADEDPQENEFWVNFMHDYDDHDEIAMQVNGLNKGTESNDTISIPLMKSMDPDDESNILEPDYQFYLSYDFYDKDNPNFHLENIYGFHQIKKKEMQLFTPQLNHISMKLPSFPLLSQRDIISPIQFCNSSTVKHCKNKYCACTHVLHVKLGSVVELVLVDEGVTFDANHPFHLHGHAFRVIAMGRVNRSVTVNNIKKLDAAGLIQRRLKHAPLKDTVTVPDGGYTIVRFHANNPGYWLFHCHIEFHVEIGMALVFKVGEHEEMLPVPKNFPRCGDWKPTNLPEITIAPMMNFTTEGIESNEIINGVNFHKLEYWFSSATCSFLIFSEINLGILVIIIATVF